MSFLIIKIGIAISILYPAVVVRARMQDSRKKIVFRKVTNETTEVNLRAVCRILWRTEGYKGFYSGIKFDLVRILISNAILYLVYEKVKLEISEVWFRTDFED